MATKQHFRVCKASTLVRPQRRSPRIQKLASAAQKEVRSNSQLPSPSPSRSVADAPRTSKKRKHSDNITPNEEGRHPKRRQIVQEGTKSSQLISCPIAHWVETSSWPKSYGQDRPAMNSSKRRSSSTHHSDRKRQLEQNGIYFKISAQQVQQKSRDLCGRLLDGDLEPDQFPCYPAEKVDEVLDLVQSHNEARLYRDVTPIIMPSAENLVLSGKLAHQFIGEEVSAEWSRCQPMGGKRPKPDLAVGLQRSAFSPEEWAKLENHETSSRPFNLSHRIWFPFLLCEAKTDRAGLEAADIQNIHSGSLAVRSILRVYIAAYGRHDQKVKDLLGRILVFSVTHNCQQVNLFGHYALATDDSNDEGENFQYLRYGIGMYSLGSFGDKQRYRAYNFVRNVYDKFAPEHRDRLRDAIGALERPEPRTGLSFSASELAVDDEGLSQTASVQQEGIFKTPSEPASVATKRLMEQVERQREQMDTLLHQLAEQRRESSEQLEQQRKESGEERERMARQMQEQQRESREQLDQLINMVSALSKPKDT